MDQMGDRFQDVLGLLRAPETLEPLELLTLETAGGTPREGLLLGAESGELRGRLRDFKFDFLRLDGVSVDEARRRQTAGEAPVERGARPVVEEVRFDDGRVRYEGAWLPEADNTLFGGDGEAGAAELTAEMSGGSVTFLASPWSGRLRVELDGRTVEEVDLYREWDAAAVTVSVGEGLPFGAHTIRVVPLREKSAGSYAPQVRLTHFAIESERTEPVRYERKIDSRANEFPKRFWKLLESVSSTGWIFDCGGGRRQLDHPRYVNLDYDGEEFPDVYGDGHRLPFQSGSFELVLSQAVLEHMRDPFLGAREIARVTAPGALAYVEIAFMQPIHCPPEHYFNTTIWGARELFQHMEIVDSGWFGGLEGTVGWMLDSCRVRGRLEEGEREELSRILRKCDTLMSYEDSMWAASGVYVLCRKKG